MRRLLPLAVVAIVAAWLPIAPLAAADDSPKVIGGGSSFVELEMDQWRADVAGPPYNLKIDYTAAGSTFGRTQFHNGQLDFAGSDIPYQPSDSFTGPTPPFVYVPESAGGLGFMYNLIGNDGRRITNLHLTARDVCRAFTVPDIMWNDPQIQADNPGLQLPARPVRPVVRADGSGTSYVFSDYCIQTQPDVWNTFRAFIVALPSGSPSQEFTDGLPTSNWPTNNYGRSSTATAADGVANVVANDVTGADAITYNEAGFARVKGLPNAWVANAAGVYKQPDAAAVTQALAYAEADPNNSGTFNLHKTYTTPDPDAYFPSTYSYIIAPTTIDPAKGRVIATFLDYAVTKGQQRAVPLGFARLSNVLVNLALDKIQQIPGAPPRPTDLGGAPPPVATKTGLAAIAATNAAAQRTAAAAHAAATAQNAAAEAAAANNVAAAAANTGAATDAGASADNAATGNTHLSPVAATEQQASATNPMSDKDAFFFFLIGFGLVALGAGTGVAKAASRRKEPV
jgi:phosphate transport system substrate-binding protein